jgi:hypothetical protein
MSTHSACNIFSTAIAEVPNKQSVYRSIIPPNPDDLHSTPTSNMVASDVLFNHNSATYENKIGSTSINENIRSGLLSLGHRIHLLSPASSSNAASSQSCGASMDTIREQSRHQVHSQACMHTRILDRLYSDNSNRFGLAHLRRRSDHREIKGIGQSRGRDRRGEDTLWTSSRDDELGQFKFGPLVQH